MNRIENQKSIFINECTLNVLKLFIFFIFLLNSSLFAKSMTIEANKGEVIQLDKQVSEVFVANPDIADVQLNSGFAAYVTGKKPGSTSIVATDAKGKIIFSLDVKVIHNIYEIQQTLKLNFPQVDVRVISTPEGLILQGVAHSQLQIKDIESVVKNYLGPSGAKEQLLNQMSVSSPVQVLLKVKIAEVGRTVLSQFQINWTSLGSAKNLGFGILNGRNPFNSPSPTSPGSFSRNPSNSGGGSFGIQFNDSTTNLMALIDALDQQGLASVLAEPNLIALSGETASFLAGGEIPYLIPQDQNVSVVFKQFGISLAFTPTVLSSKTINLRVRPEVSQLDYSNAQTIVLNSSSGASVTVPALKTRRTETSVVLGSGQSLAIAGLISNNMTSSLGGIPGIKDIPILGALFGSTSFSRNESELVIIVTPYLVEPTDHPSTLVLPTDSLKYASNLEMLFGQRLNKVSEKKNMKSSEKDSTSISSSENKSVNFSGAAGFKVE